MILFLLFLLVVSYQPLFLSKADSDYQETLSLSVGLNQAPPAYGDLSIHIFIDSVKETSNYTSVFMNVNFKRIDISWNFRWYGDTLGVYVVFDSSRISSVGEGNRTSETIMKRVEDVWGIKLTYKGCRVYLTSTQYETYNETSYDYEAEEELSRQQLREIINHYCPDAGFGRILRSINFGEYADVYMKLELDEKCSPVWNMGIDLRYEDYLYVNLNHEYGVSLRNLTGYAESIQSSPEASHSYISASVNKPDSRYAFLAHPIPGNMMVGLGYDSFSLDIKGGSADDLGVTFSFVSPSDTRDVFTLLFSIATYVAIIFVAYIFYEKTKPRYKRVYYVT